MADEAPVVEEEVASAPVAVAEDLPSLTTVADVLTFARTKIAGLTGMPSDAVKLALKMGV